MSKEATETKKKNNTLIKLYVGSFLVSALPLMMLVIFRWNTYVKSVPAGAIRLSIAGIIAAVVLLFKITGHLHIKSHFVWYVGFALFFWLIKSVANDLSLVFICAAIGDGVDEIFFQTAIKKERKKRDMEKQAEIIIEQMGQMGKAGTSE